MAFRRSVKLSILAIAALLLLGDVSMAINTTPDQRNNDIRSYFNFSFPPDPAKIVTLPDMDVSYALASTLVDWSDSKQIQSGLAAKWTLVSDRTYRFELRNAVRWSDHTLITCNDVQRSFERAKRVHGSSLRALFDRIASINCTPDGAIEFMLREPPHDDSFLQKLTEPMYGVLKIDSKGELNLGVSAGPFRLEKKTAEELILVRNPHWHLASSGMVERVILRRPMNSPNMEETLLHDPWPNVIPIHYPLDEAISKSLSSKRYEIWTRSLDRVFLLSYFGKKKIGPAEAALLKYLSEALNRESLLHGISGATPGEQMFPRGYTLYSADFPKRETKSELPETYKARPLRILYSPERVSPALLQRVAQWLLSATEQKPSFQAIPISSLYDVASQGGFDLYLGSFGVADPNHEGALSFFYELDTPTIPSGAGNLDFRKRLADARREKDPRKRLLSMRSIIRDSVTEGFVLPIFHFSTTVMAKPDVDFSQVPTTDESVNFAKVRSRQSQAKQ